MVNRGFFFFMSGKHRIILAAKGAVYSLEFGAEPNQKMEGVKQNSLKQKNVHFGKTNES